MLLQTFPGYYCASQGTKEWMSNRNLCLYNASSIADIVLPASLTYNSKAFRWQATCAKVHKEVGAPSRTISPKVKEFMKHGIEMEKYALEYAVNKHFGSDAVYYNNLGVMIKEFDGLKIGGSLDGLIILKKFDDRTAEQMIIEVKCPAYTKEAKEAIDWKYIIQLEVNLRLYDLEKALFITCGIDYTNTEKTNVKVNSCNTMVYTRSDALWNEILRRLKYFTDTYVLPTYHKPPNNSFRNKEELDRPMLIENFVDYDDNVVLLS